MLFPNVDMKLGDNINFLNRIRNNYPGKGYYDIIYKVIDM